MLQMTLSIMSTHKSVLVNGQHVHTKEPLHIDNWASYIKYPHHCNSTHNNKLITLGWMMVDDEEEEVSFETKDFHLCLPNLDCSCFALKLNTKLSPLVLFCLTNYQTFWSNQNESHQNDFVHEWNLLFIFPWNKWIIHWGLPETKETK